MRHVNGDLPESTPYSPTTATCLGGTPTFALTHETLRTLAHNWCEVAFLDAAAKATFLARVDAYCPAPLG